MSNSIQFPTALDSDLLLTTLPWLVELDVIFKTFCNSPSNYVKAMPQWLTYLIMVLIK